MREIPRIFLYVSNIQRNIQRNLDNDCIILAKRYKKAFPSSPLVSNSRLKKFRDILNCQSHKPQTTLTTAESFRCITEVLLKRDLLMASLSTRLFTHVISISILGLQPINGDPKRQWYGGHVGYKTKRSVIQHGCHTIVFWISRDWLQTKNKVSYAGAVNYNENFVRHNFKFKMADAEEVFR